MADAAEAVAHECEHCGARLLACDFDGSDGDADDFAYAVDHHVSGSCCKVAARVARELAAGEFTLRPRGDPLIAFCASKRGLGQLAVDHLGAIAAHHDVDELGPNLPGLAFATALHAASKLDNVELVAALLAAGADAARTTQDFVPDEGPGDPGGRTALHVAAAANAARAAAAIARARPELLDSTDWEGRTPSDVAWVEGHDELSAELSGKNGVEEEARQIWRTPRERPRAAAEREAALGLREVELVERQHAAQSVLEYRPRLRALHLLRGLWSPEQCDAALKSCLAAARFHGWSTRRHKSFATVDLPIWQATDVSEAVRRSLADEILPALARAYGVDLATLALSEAFLIRYSASGQSELGFHRDGHVFSCNILLNDGFAGGGTRFEEAAPLHVSEGGAWREAGWPAEAAPPEEVTQVRGAVGDCLLHCGKHRHGGGAVTSGTRFVLVCFIAELVPSPRALPADSGFRRYLDRCRRRFREAHGREPCSSELLRMEAE